MKKKEIITSAIVLIFAVGGVYFLVNPLDKNQGDDNLANQANLSNENQNQQTTINYNIQGMKIEILQQGTGEGSKVGDNISVNYTGTLLDGTKFDSSIGREPFEYTLGQNRVIQGWELGLLNMKVGEKRKLTIPPELGYGTQGAGGVIPPNATLIFEVEMLNIN